MRKSTLLAAAALLLAGAESRADDLKEAESILAKAGSPASGSLRVAALERSKELTENDVVGMWKGKSTQGDNTISVDLEFGDNGSVSNKASNGLSGKGNWKLDGDTIEVTWSNGAKVRWKVEDGEISGKGTTSRGQPWSLYFKKQ